MFRPFIAVVSCAILALALVLVLPSGAGAAEPAIKDKLVLQVSDNDPAKWNLALGNVRNVQAALGVKNVDIEIVVYGPGIGMLQLESVVGNRVAETLATGVRIVACLNTMDAQHLSEADMLPRIGYVRAGVVELMRRQQEGYAYVRP